MPAIFDAAAACLLLGLMAPTAHAVRVVTTAPTGGLQGVGSGAGGSVGGAGGTQTHISVKPGLGVDIGKTSLIQVDDPNVGVRTAAGAVVVETNSPLSLGRTLRTVSPDGTVVAVDRSRASSANTSLVTGETGIEGDQKPKTGLQKLDKAAQGIEEAAKLEKDKKVRSGAVSSKLDQMFDFKKKEVSFDVTLPDAGGSTAKSRGAVVLDGLPDPHVVGVDKAVSKLAALAANAGSAQAPFLYKRAVDIAREAKEGAKAEGILRKAVKRAKGAVTESGNKAFAAAAKGRTTDALSYTKSVYGWNSLLSSDKRPLIGNFNEFKDAVKHVLGQALDNPGKELPAPTVNFEKSPQRADAQLQAKISMPEGIPSQVAFLPENFVVDLALPDTVISWEDVAALELGRPTLHQGFRLTAQAGFRAFYRAHRRAGASVLKSFWLAARQFASSTLSGLWQRLRALVVTLLRGLGILSGGTGLTVDVSSVDKLRAAKPVRIELGGTPATTGDRLNLGYQLYPVAH